MVLKMWRKPDEETQVISPIRGRNQDLSKKRDQVEMSRKCTQTSVRPRTRYSA